MDFGLPWDEFMALPPRVRKTLIEDGLRVAGGEAFCRAKLRRTRQELHPAEPLVERCLQDAITERFQCAARVGGRSSQFYYERLKPLRTELYNAELFLRQQPLNKLAYRRVQGIQRRILALEDQRAVEVDRGMRRCFPALGAPVPLDGLAPPRQRRKRTR